MYNGINAILLVISGNKYFRPETISLSDLGIVANHVSPN